MIHHIVPAFDPVNGVALYGSLINTIIEKLPDDLTRKTITHIELGSLGHMEFWQAFRLRRRPEKHKLVLTLHDPPLIIEKPFANFISSGSLPAKALRRAFDLTVGRQLVCQVIRSADAVMILNRQAKGVLSDAYGFPEERIVVSALPDIVGPVQSQEGISLLFFGNIAKHKGIHLLIEAYQAAGLDKCETPLIVVGDWCDPSYRRRVEKVASGISHVTFRGKINPVELRQEIAKARIVVLPYTDCGIIPASGPLVAAMGAGKAVIASDIPLFNGYITTGQNGLLFNPGDIGSLSATLQNLLSDGILRRRLGKAAVRYVEDHCSIDVIIKDLTRLYSIV